MVLTENTAKVAGGRRLTKSWTEIVNPKPVDPRSAEEIAADVMRRCGLRFKDG